MGTHRRPPAEPQDGYEDPPPTPGPASRGRRTRADRKAERLAKTERAVAEYARRDAERAARRAARRPAEAGAHEAGSTARVFARSEADPAAEFAAPYGEAGLPAAGPAQPAPPVTAAWFEDEVAAATDGRRRNGSGVRSGDRKPAKSPRQSREPKEKAVRQPRPPRPKDPRRRRRRIFLAAFSALGLAAAVGGGLAVANFAESAPGEDTPLAPVAVMSPTAMRQLTAVPAAVLDKVGAGSAVTLLGRVDAPPLKSGKKPRLLYIGAESCPLCAAERWSLVVALSRFGTWSNLGVILSPKEELYPNTPSLSFHGASYTSKYLAFTGYETTSRVRAGTAFAPLDPVPAADLATMRALRAAPYVPEEATNRLPFVDLAGKFVGAGTHVRFQVLGLFAGNSPDQVAAALSDPTSYLAKAINGGANAWTAAICETLPKKTRPTKVCSSPAVKAGKSILRAKR